MKSRSLPVAWLFVFVPSLATALPPEPSIYGNSTVVATSGGNYADPVTAMNDLASWCGVPSDSNRCQLRIMAGNYTINGTLASQAWVDISGAGKHSTVLEGSGANAPIVSIAEDSEVANLMVRAQGYDNVSRRYGVVFGADVRRSVLRDARVEILGRAVGSARGVSYYTGTPTIAGVEVRMNISAWSTGIIGSYGDPDIRDSVVTMEGASKNIGIETMSGRPALTRVRVVSRGAPSNEAIRLRQSRARLIDVEARAEGGTGGGTGILITGGGNSSPTLISVQASGTGTAGGYGIYANAAQSQTLLLDGSGVYGSTEGVHIDGGHSIKIASSRIENHVVVGAGTAICAGVVDGADFSFHANDCP